MHPDPRTDLVSAIRTVPGDEDDTWAFVSLHPFVWPRLTELDVSGCRLGESAAVLIAIEPFPALADFDFSANDLTDADVDGLLETDLPQQLKRLILGGNPLSDDAALALGSRWPTGEDDRLEHLNLRFTNIGAAGQAALLRRFGGRVDLF